MSAHKSSMTPYAILPSPLCASPGVINLWVFFIVDAGNVAARKLDTPGQVNKYKHAGSVCPFLSRLSC